MDFSSILKCEVDPEQGDEYVFEMEILNAILTFMKIKIIVLKICMKKLFPKRNHHMAQLIISFKHQFFTIDS